MVDRPIWGDLSPGHLFYEARKIAFDPMFGLMRELKGAVLFSPLHASRNVWGLGTAYDRLRPMWQV
jgi:hypothetical protein